jgi:general secretion pathway protein M
MTPTHRVELILARFPVAAAVLYAVMIFAFVFIAGEKVAELMAWREAVADSSDVLARLEARAAEHTRSATSADVAVPPGSPFLEGATISSAGAALLQRVAAATTRVHGNIFSSQIDLQEAQSNPGFLSASVTFEIDAASLQPILYDLEAGMPFLFVNQLVVQAPSVTPSTGEGKLRVTLSVSGRWEGAR